MEPFNRIPYEILESLAARYSLTRLELRLHALPATFESDFDPPLLQKTLSDRMYACPCGFVADRDMNAARNFLSLGRSDQAQMHRDTEHVA